MTDTLDSTGLSLDTLAERTAATEGRLRAAISSVLDLGPDQPMGQLLRINAELEQEFAELVQEVYSGLDPDQATGQTLDAICSITGTYRRPATRGTVSLTLTFTAAATVSAGSLVSVTGDPDNVWEIDEDVVAAGAGVETGSATCTTAGNVPATAGTITTIVTPVANWAAVTNVAAVSAGLDLETDTELRLRREVEVTTGGSTSVDAVHAAVSPITGVLEAIVYENATWRAVAPMPPHSIEVVFWSTYTGAALTTLEALIAEEVFEEKAGGVQAYGTTEVTHTDSQGNDHQIGMTLAAEQVLQVEYTLTTDGDYPGNATFRTTVAEAFGLGISDDVYAAKMIDIGFNVPGVVNISSLRLRWSGGAWGTADLPVNGRQIATLGSSVTDVVVI